MRSYDEVEEFFETELLPEVRAQRERLEEAQRERQKLALPISTKLGIVAAGLVVDALLGGLGVTWLAIAAAVLSDAWRARGLPRPPRFDVKRELIGRTVRFLDPSLEYDPTGRVPDYVLRDSGLWSAACDSISGEDRIYGKLGATLFDLSEIRIGKRYGEKTQRLFTGLLFVADFNKEFRSRTYVLPDASERHLGMLGRAVQKAAFSAGRGELVQLENPEFERFFRVHSSDPNEARYLLSPSLMNRIRQFRENLNAELSLSFVDGRIYVLLEHPGDLLGAVGVDQVDASVLRRWLGELLFATSLVEEFDLNTRIWSKAPADVPFRPPPPVPSAAATGTGTGPRTQAHTPARNRQLASAAHTALTQPAHTRAAPLARLAEAALAGRVPLWQVWLVFGAGIPIGVAQLSGLLVRSGALPAGLASLVGLCAVLPGQFLVWRNASNCEWLGWTLLARGAALLSLVALAAALASLLGLGPPLPVPAPPGP